MKAQVTKFRMAVLGAIASIGSAGIGVAVADHFNVNNYPNGWTYTVNEGQKICFNGCSFNQVACDAPGKHGSQQLPSSITYHPKGEGGMNNPHVFTVYSGPPGSKVGPNDKDCPNQTPPGGSGKK